MKKIVRNEREIGGRGGEGKVEYLLFILFTYNHELKINFIINNVIIF